MGISAMLAGRGWSEADLAQLTCRNILRVMRDVEAGARDLQGRRGPGLARIEDLDRPVPLTEGESSS